MTVPFRVGEDDPLDVLKAMKAQRDPLDELKAMKPKRPLSQPTDTNNQPTDEELEAARPSGGVLGHLVNTAQGIPGGELAQTGLRMLFRGESQDEALKDIRGATKKINKPLAVAERFAGSLPLIKLPIKSPVAMGATVGAADQALDADPEKGLGERALGSAIGATGGALAGKAAETVTTLGRALIGKSSSARLLAKEAARDATAATDYGRALHEGTVHGTNTPEMRAWLAQPDVAEIHQALLQNREFQGLAPHDPKVLDAVYKVFSDHGQQVKRGLESPTPSRPNLGRYTKRDIDLAKSEGMKAFVGAQPGAGPMPSYQPAVENFAKASDEIDAVRRGEDILRSGLNKGVTTGKNLDRTTPEAFGEWAKSASQGLRDAAGEGIIGAAKENFIKHPIRNIAGAMVGRGAIGKAPSLMRTAGSRAQSLTDVLTNLGLIAGRADASP